MASILPGFQYDIFISYRNNDNKYLASGQAGGGWVTEFVDKLKQELDATIKDKLTVFFDKNPQDGLFETHQVYESIQGKIKALIFIPIISQTYCDITSFAWKSEFLVFKSETETDAIGKVIRTPGGNVISRILPVKIHDIEEEDVRLLQRELGGMMRSIDFIYHEAGVNRPLRSVDDDLPGGTGRLLFRNQINKVANSIKEIINGIKALGPDQQKSTTSHTLTSEKPMVAGSFTTSLPPGIKVHVMDSFRPSVFLAWTSSDLKPLREEMALILQKAGFSVLPSVDCPSDDGEFKDKVADALKKATCSLHIVGNEFGRRFEAENDMSFPKYQFLEVKKMLESYAAEFHAFIWNVNDPARPVNPSQQDFIRYIRNNITRNMMFSNSLGPMQLVDDIRVVVMKKSIQELDIHETDIFFIFNQQDEVDASRITDLISSEYPVEIMNILPDGEAGYREISAQQIPKSKLAVVYFKYAADWALPFIKQVWKQVGGASSPTPLMLIGEDDPASNKARYFKAPKVVSSIVPKESIPAEVKKVYVQILKLN